MAAARRAKITTTKKAIYKLMCPTCKAQGTDQAMSIIKMVRQTKPSGMFWVCPKCNTEVPTQR